jgi:hypothetical protein
MAVPAHPRHSIALYNFPLRAATGCAANQFLLDMNKTHIQKLPFVPLHDHAVMIAVCRALQQVSKTNPIARNRPQIPYEAAPTFHACRVAYRYNGHPFILATSLGMTMAIQG